MNLLWFRNDLRLSDQPALHALAGHPLNCIYIFDTARTRPLGGAARWRLHHSLAQLGADMVAKGGRLTLYRGDPQLILPQLVQQGGVKHVAWNRRYQADAIACDRELKAQLKLLADVSTYNGSLLIEPWQLQNKSGQAFKVFTPFWKTLRHQLPELSPLPAPEYFLNAPVIEHASRVELADLALLPLKPDWASGFSQAYRCGEREASLTLQRFLDERLAAYPEQRDIPALDMTSGLSSALVLGEISPRQIFAAVQLRLMEAPFLQLAADKFLSEIAWREFSKHLLFHFPHLQRENFNSAFNDFAWQNGVGQETQAWQKGLTGYPIVDAGMRQLWLSGTMHNRVRMIVASFLVKHLLTDWRVGEAWFWDTLCDADLAANCQNWQWVAGCGVDAAPYFRIFNPVLQGKKFDPKGDYVRRWVPELASVPNAYIHTPWMAPASLMQQTDVALGLDYPLPIINHNFARERALSAFRARKSETDNML